MVLKSYKAAAYALIYPGIIFMFTFAVSLAHAEVDGSQQDRCQGADRQCIGRKIEQIAEEIPQDRWRDQTYRELAKFMAADGQAMTALALIDKIKSPDTKALTIRGIGVEAAMADQVPEELFPALRQQAERIKHSASYAIALTYIAMAQAFAGDDAGAINTAKDMENNALRNKAFAETAEIQAEYGKQDAAIETISYIDDENFRDKAYRIVSEIFAKAGADQQAYDVASKIINPVVQVEALQTLLSEQKRRMQKLVKND